MLQRSKKPAMTPARQALKLLEMRDEVRAEFGEHYAAVTGPYKPLVSAALRHLQCPVRAATLVVNNLHKDERTIVTKKLVTCAAIDLAMLEELKLAS